MPRNNNKKTKHDNHHPGNRPALSKPAQISSPSSGNPSQIDVPSLEKQLIDCQETARIHDEKRILAAQEAKGAQEKIASDTLKRLDELKVFTFLEDLQKHFPDIRTDGNTASLSALETAILQLATDLARKADPMLKGKAKPIEERDVVELTRDRAVEASERYDWGLTSPFSDERT